MKYSKQVDNNVPNALICSKTSKTKKINCRYLKWNVIAGYAKHTELCGEIAKLKLVNVTVAYYASLGLRIVCKQ
jgi:hypothetical protein